MVQKLIPAALAWFVFAASSIPTTAVAQKGTTIDISQLRFLQKAKLVGAAVNQHNIDALEAEFDRIVQRELPPEKLKPLLWKMTDELGNIQQMGEPRLLWTDVAVIPVQFEKGLLDLRLTLDSANKISGFYFIPHRNELPIPARSITPLSLPFSGKWSVMWGGDTREDNFNHDIKNQRYAIDLNVTDDIGNSHTGDGTKNEDFFAYGKEVLAPANGVVTEAIDGVRDNIPSSGNAYSSLGNAVLIKHSETECSVLAYLQRGSVRVKAGDTITRGTVVGLCGNSGNSTEPHIHFHLQNSPIMQDATAIKAYFTDVGVQHPKKLDRVEKEYAPIREDKIESK